MLNNQTKLMIENLADRWQVYEVSAEEIAQELDSIQFDTLTPKDFEEIEDVYRSRLRWLDDYDNNQSEDED